MSDLQQDEAKVQADVHGAISKLEADLKAAEAKTVAVWKRWEPYACLGVGFVIGFVVGHFV